MEFDDRVKLVPFEGATTYRNDFRIPPLQPYVKHIWPAERTPEADILPPKPQRYTCPETITKLNDDVYIPMNLMWQPDPFADGQVNICRVPPAQKDNKKEEAIRTRPRVYMKNAVSIDDVNEPEVRNLLLSYMYITECQKAMKETYEFINAKRMEADPKTKECVHVVKPPVPCRIRDESIPSYVPTILPNVEKNVTKVWAEWDKEQIRTNVTPSVQYWSKFYKDRQPEKPLGALIPVETIERLTKLIETDKIRFPHDKTPCGYAGYIPMMTRVDIEKVELPMVHPMHTTNHTVFVNHYAHANNNYEK